MDLNKCRYSTDHWWVATDSPSLVTIGLTENAQWSLGDLLFIELPEVATKIGQGEKIGEIEGNKASVELFAPLSVEIVELNNETINDPRRLKDDPSGIGWLMKANLSNPDELKSLISFEVYSEAVEQMRENT